jgi:PAS domain S-box-containing protein
VTPEIRVRRHRAIWAPLAVLVTGVAASLLFWQAVVADRRSFVDRETGDEAALLAAHMSAEMRSQVQGLYRMAQRWEARKSMPQEEWESDTRLYVAHNSGYQAIVWIDPSSVVRWIVPLSGNESLLGANFADQPLYRETLETARQNGDKTLSRPVRIANGSTGFLACSPVYLPGGFGGWIVGLIRLDPFLNETWYDELAQGYSVSLLYAGHELYRRGTRALSPDAIARDADVELSGENLAGVSLRLRVWPSPALLASRSSLPRWTLIVGLLVSCLLSLSVGLAQIAGRANERLKAEISERERGHAERARVAAFTADVGGALTRSESLPRALEASAEAMVRHLGAASATIWVLNSKDAVLERRAKAGDGVDPPDSLERIPVGQFRIGRIAAEGVPRITDLTQDPPEAGDKDWARRQGMVSFAGHPLIVAGRSLGVMTMFAREPITESALHAMATVADSIALGIDRAWAADSLRASETLTRSIIEGMLDGLVTVDAANRIKSVNPAAQRIFGYTRGELIGQPLSCLAPDFGGAAPDAFLREARVRAMGRVTEWQGRRKDGATFPFELALFEFWTSEGRHFGGAIKDLSEHYEIDRLKREFVSTVSHELRTPLTSIRGALGLVAGGAAGPLPAQAKSLLDIALKNSERLARLVNDILDMEKIEAGQLQFNMEELQIAPLLEAAVEGNRAYAEQFGVVLAVENDAPGVRVRADMDRLTQVITNLLSNAVKFSPKGETVRLAASRRESIVRLEVRDRGPGIPEEFRSRIFGRFQQADSSDTRQKGGTGLGLAITRLIVEQLGGMVGFETEIGRGSTFWVELPLVGVGAARPVSASEVGAPRPRILHVDDDPDLPTIVASALSEFADVDVARGIREARERLTSMAYDVVVLDVVLPDGSGLELQPLLAHPAGTSTPFILFTAHEIPQEAAGAAAAVLVKSRSTVAELVESVKSLFAGTSRPTVSTASDR